jgi:hypothetical protein
MLETAVISRINDILPFILDRLDVPSHHAPDFGVMLIVHRLLCRPFFNGDPDIAVQYNAQISTLHQKLVNIRIVVGQLRSSANAFTEIDTLIDAVKEYEQVLATFLLTIEEPAASQPLISVRKDIATAFNEIYERISELRAHVVLFYTARDSITPWKIV